MERFDVGCQMRHLYIRAYPPVTEWPFGCRHSPLSHLILARAKAPSLLRSAFLACQPITGLISGEHNARRAKFQVSHSLAENQKGLSSGLVHFISRETYLEVTFC